MYHLLQDRRIPTFTNVNTSDIYVNGWADLGGWEYSPVTSFLMITNKLLDEMPFRDVTEFMILDNEQNSADKYMYNMSTNNDCLVEFDPYHNLLETGTVKKCSNYDTSL